MQAEPAGGRMVAVGASEEQVRAAIEPFSRTVSIAAINGPRNVVISGAASDIEIIVSQLASRGAPCKDLIVSHAFHSPLMEPMLAAYEKVVRSIPLRKPTVPLISNVTGRLADPEEISRPDYWLRHVREPVRFAQGVQSLADAGCHIFHRNGTQPRAHSNGAAVRGREQTPCGCRRCVPIATIGMVPRKSAGAVSRGSGDRLEGL